MICSTENQSQKNYFKLKNISETSSKEGGFSDM